MAALPQPIYPNDLNSAMNRLHAQLPTLFDARIDSVIAQMRADKEDSLLRATSPLKLIENHIESIETRIESIEKHQDHQTKLLVAIAQSLNIKEV